MASPDSLDYPEWLKTNPPPDLQKLVATYGGYDAITPEAWTLFDQAKAEWESRRRDRLFGSHTWALPEINPRKLK